ncbi:hypothetical protein ACJJTC_006660 [Scirpophaga incertulas]
MFSTPPRTMVKTRGALAREMLSHTAEDNKSEVLSPRRKQLELEKAEAKAGIEKNLIEKRLAAQLAELEGGSSRRSQASSIDSIAKDSNKVEEWLNKSQQEQQQQRAVTLPSALPAVPCTSDLQHLARAME